MMNKPGVTGQTVQADGATADVPYGATPKEVADDIPAQLSEGEYIFPADVTRWYGLEKLSKLHQAAKQGLMAMQQNEGLPPEQQAEAPMEEPAPDPNAPFKRASGGFMDPYATAYNQNTPQNPTYAYTDQFGRTAYGPKGPLVGVPTGTYVPPDLTPTAPKPVNNNGQVKPSNSAQGLMSEPRDNGSEPGAPMDVSYDNFGDWAKAVGQGLAVAGSLTGPLGFGLAMANSAITGQAPLTGTGGTLTQSGLTNMRQAGSEVLGLNDPLGQPADQSRVNAQKEYQDSMQQSRDQGEGGTTESAPGNDPTSNGTGSQAAGGGYSGDADRDSSMYARGGFVSYR